MSTGSKPVQRMFTGSKKCWENDIIVQAFFFFFFLDKHVVFHALIKKVYCVAGITALINYNEKSKEIYGNPFMKIISV